MAARFLGGRLEKKLGSDAMKLLVSEDIEWDRRIVEEDTIGSQAHAIMLWKTGVLTEDELKEILKALEKVKKLSRQGKFKLDPMLEDVHLNVENFVIGEAGLDAGGKLHTGRSRNDQIILDLRLHLRKEVNETIGRLTEVIRSFLELAEKHTNTVMPGYTHLQHAQPITLGHWLTAYCGMFLRDLERLENAYRLINLNPLGAGALAGTSWPIDRAETARLLGFEGIQGNSLDVVTSRGEDIAEILFVLAMLMVHISRLSEDLMLWSTYEFRMVQLDDAYSMGSSIMPQKKNPDTLELLRGKTSSVLSELMLTLSIMKSLPSGYYKDMQETKNTAFKTLENVKNVLTVLKGIVSTLKVDKRRMLRLVSENFSTATDLADLIAKKTDVPFRVTHRIVGAMVKDALEENKTSQDVGLKELNKASLKVTGRRLPLTDKEVRDALDPLQSIRSKKSLGSPNPKEVSRMMRENLNMLKVKIYAYNKRTKKLEEALSHLQVEINKIIGKT